MTGEEEKKEEPKEEEKQEKEEEVEESVVDSSDLISKANLAAERLENANKEHEKLLAIQQKIHVQNTLAGKATAGVPAKTKDETTIENAKKFLEGTGIEDMAFPDDEKK